MAKPPPPKKSAAPAQPTDRRAALTEAREHADKELTGLRHQHAAALDALLSDPFSAPAAARSEELRSSIAALEHRIATFDAAMDRAETEALEEERRARAQATASDRAQIVQLSKHRAEQLAPAIDTALASLLAAVHAYCSTGQAIAELTTRTTSNLHGEDVQRAHDLLMIYLPRASGATTSVAEVLAERFRRIVVMLDCDELKQATAPLDRFAVGRPSTNVAEASHVDARRLAEWFHQVPGEEAPRPHRVVERSFIDNAIRERDEVVMYAGPASANLEPIEETPQ